MRFTLLLLATFSAPLAAPIFAVAHASEPAPPERILITAFEPFGGAEENNSWDIAQAVENAREIHGPDVEVTVCRLPVVYDEAAAAAKACYEAMNEKPLAVISLGEAGCDLRLETAAHNLDDTPGFPDNDGNIRTGSPILEGAPDSIGFDLPVQEMYCALSPDESAKVRISETPGGFVCNNTSFHLANYFQGEGVQFGFVHVPNSRCPATRKDPIANGDILARMIRELVDYDRADPPDGHVMPHCSNEERLPTEVAAVDSLLESLSEADAKACEREFLEKLKERL